MTTVDKASGAKPIYMYRSVMNAEEIVEWAREQGFGSTLEPNDMHVTVVFSKAAFSRELTEVAESHGQLGYSNIVVRGGKRAVVPLGDKGAVVLKIQSDQLQYEHMEFRGMGASWDFQEYTPHVTITYRGTTKPPSEIMPFTGDIVLGPLRAKPLNPEWDTEIAEIDLATQGGAESLQDVSRQKDLSKTSDSHIVRDMAEHEVNKSATILKLDTERRIVWGWASVSTLKGELVTDLQGDRMSPAVMSKMADGFMRSVRAAKAMHEGEDVGEVIHSFPLTKELADAFGIQTDREGWITGTYIKSDEEWAKVLKGEYRGLSIGGKAKRRPA